MKIDEFIKAVSYLGMAYGKEYSQAETMQMYEFLKEYNYQTMIEAVKSIIRTSKYVPKIADLIEACENCKSSTKIAVVKYMRDSGYFKLCDYGEITDEHATRNYNKVMMWLERGVMPDWLQEDINYYYLKMKNKALENNEQTLLED